MVDFKSGKEFSITSGGITHGIKRELGLTNAECQELKNQSIWTQIINEFDNPNNMQVLNNHNDTPDKSNNYLVHAKAVVQFSKDCWNKIVGLINKALNKNIETEEKVKSTDSVSQETIKPSQQSGVQEKNFHDLSSEQQELIQSSANELIKDIQDNKISLPKSVDSAKVIEFLKSQNILQIPIEQQIPTTKDAAKQALLNVSVLISQSGQVSPTQFTEEQMKEKLNNIRQKLNTVLKGKIFDGPNGTTVTGEQILDIINKQGEDGNFTGIQFEDNNYGAARADAANKRILMNRNAQYYSNSDAEIMKIIIHEALHCVYNVQTGDTWDEERCCESQALKITADIVKSEENNPNSTFGSFIAYNRDIKDFAGSDTLLNQTIDTWLETGYANRAKNSQGDITIIKDTSLVSRSAIQSGSLEYMKPENRIEIHAGDEVWIDGKKVTTIGEAKLESELLTEKYGNSNVCRLFTKLGQTSVDTVVFDGTVDNTVDKDGNKVKLPQTEPKEFEIRGHGRVVKGKIYC